jgi:hypothetical protein
MLDKPIACRDICRTALCREFVSRCLFFGDDGIGGYWGIKRDLPGKVIRWDAEWGEDFEVDGDDPLAAWLAEKQRYEAIQTSKPNA